jgi:polyhydroxyalkanoate synthesis regulator phasin
MKKILIIGGSVAVLLAAILVGAFFAGPLIASAHSNQNATTTSSTATNPYCEQYLQALASKLNVSVTTLEQDQLSAKETVINQAVKDGKLTQAQATAIEQKLTSHQACSRSPQRLPWQGFVTRQFLQKYRSDIVNQVAQGLHLSSSQLTSDLKAGESLTQIATAQHVSAAQLKTIVTNAINSALKTAVSDGDLTQAQATAYSTYVQNHPQWLQRLLNGHAHKG